MTPETFMQISLYVLEGGMIAFAIWFLYSPKAGRQISEFFREN